MSPSRQRLQAVRYQRVLEISIEDSDVPPILDPADPRAMRRRVAQVLEDRSDLDQEASSSLATEIFKGILAGEWVLTDHFEGKWNRFLIAERSQKGDARVLSQRERQVLGLALEGHSNKYVALELGLTPSTVATHLRRTMQKLGVSSREALIQTLPIQV